MKLLIKNAEIITMDYDNPIVKGDIGIVDEKIAFIGKDNNFTPDTIKDVKGNIVMPGLINAHTHTPMSLLRCYADDLDLHEWLFDRIVPVEDTFDENDIYWGSMLACLEMIESGVTAFADMYFLNTATARAVQQNGMRANISRALQCFDDRTSFENDKLIRQALELYNQFHNTAQGRIMVDISAHAVYTNTKPYLKYIATIIDELNVGVHLHISETERENIECLEKYKMTPTQLFLSCGFFNTRTIAAHSVYLTQDDIDIYKDKNINIVTNPTSNLKLASGIAPIGKYLRNGLNIALGTDSAASNNNLNLFEEMHLASLLQKGVNKDPIEISAFDALKMATVNGADALGIENCGVLKASNVADLIIINTDKPHLMPYYNPLSAVVYSAQAADVDSVMVAGKFLMENREIKSIDVEQVKYQTKKIAARIALQST
ncbi:MAG: amidohydrolase [Clostridiaceae bacterium]|jgi:5-methylthioadenosine/S-adenosylhomocysteine deaminase|nr:amidohydrolase [Clostridiaceae bacterium]